MWDVVFRMGRRVSRLLLFAVLGPCGSLCSCGAMCVIGVCGCGDDNFDMQYADVVVLNGVVWEPGCGKEEVGLEAAVEWCSQLSVGGVEWRLPTLMELRSLIDGCADTEIGGSCSLSDECCEMSCIVGCNGCTSLLDVGGCHVGAWPGFVCGTYVSSASMVLLDFPESSLGVDFR